MKITLLKQGQYKVNTRPIQSSVLASTYVSCGLSKVNTLIRKLGAQAQKNRFVCVDVLIYIKKYIYNKTKHLDQYKEAV